MLVLSRHKDEQIVCGEGLMTVTVVEIRGDKVRLGIDAPRELPIHRREVYEAIQRERQPSATQAAEDQRALTPAELDAIEEARDLVQRAFLRVVDLPVEHPLSRLLVQWDDAARHQLGDRVTTPVTASAGGSDDAAA